MLVYRVPMIQNASGCFSASVADGSAWVEVDGWLFRRLILFDNAQSLIAGVQDFHTAYNDAFEGIAACRSQPCLARRLLRERGEPIKIQSISGQRADNVRALLFEH